MDQLKKMLAFPMWLTVVWLIWVLGQQNGIHGAASLLAQLVLLSGLVWALGMSGADGGRGHAAPTSGRFQQVAVLVFGLLWVALTWSTAQWVWRDAPQDTAPAAETQTTAPRFASGSSSSATQNAVWQVWSVKEIENINSAGQAVLVDFTAAWCVTCQWVKQTTLSDPKVLAALQQHQVHLMRADWTRRDPAITAALQSLGRSGVPVYALYLPGQAPVVLPELLTAQDVLGALETHLSPRR
jgi:thiol:disulfide interchange protein DsbD